jgi:hypothetical protein
MEDKIFIQHRFTIERDGQILQDAIVLPQDEYNKLTKEDLEAQKEARFTNWVDHIKHPPVVPELSKEEQLAQVDKDLASLEEQKQVLTKQKAEIQTAIGIKEEPLEEPVVIK